MDITQGRWRFAFLAVVLITFVGCDQTTKQLAIEHLKGTPPQSFFGDTFRMQYAENPGAFLSLAANLPDGMRFWLLTVVNAVVLTFVGTIVFLRKDIDRMSMIALTLILAGGIGNLTDRMTTQNGVVIDFLNLGIGSLRTGVFNVADMAIMAGFALLLPYVFRKTEDPASVAEA